MTKTFNNYWIILPSDRHTLSNRNSRWVHSLHRVIAYHFDKQQNHQYLNDHNLLSELKLKVVTWFGPQCDLDKVTKWELTSWLPFDIIKAVVFWNFKRFIYLHWCWRRYWWRCCPRYRTIVTNLKSPTPLWHLYCWCSHIFKSRK